MKNFGKLQTSLPIALLFPLPCFAEVSDKAASIEQIWIQSIAVGLIGLVAGRWRFVAGLLISFLGLFLSWSVLSMISDTHIGPSLGANYKSAVITSSILMLSLIAIGMWLGWRKHGLLGE